jgi:PAS domain S-box-containing protein
MGEREMITLLHVDGDRKFTDIAAKYLDREGAFDVVATQDPSEALATFRDGDFDCIVTEYELPGMNGVELLNAVREEDAEVPVILFTGRGSEEVASEAITAGVTDYIQKKHGTDKFALLANRIRNAVEGARAVRRAERSHRAMETSAEGFSFVEPDGSFSYVNPAFAGLFGYEQDELVGAEWTVLYHDDEAKRLNDEILPAVQETGHWIGETVRLTKGGERLVTDHRLSRTAGDVIVCTARDLTEERAAAADLTQPIEVLMDAIEAGGFYTLDHEGYVTFWNEGATGLTGYGSAEMLGEHVSVLFPDEDCETGEPERLLDAASAEGAVTDTRWQRAADGGRFGTELTISATYDDTGTLRGFGTVMRRAPGTDEPA